MHPDSDPVASYDAVAKWALVGNSDALRDILLVCTYDNDEAGVRAVLATGFSIDAADPVTGMSALHLAVGRDCLNMTKLLVEHGASFFPDKAGRWPTTVAAECEVGDDMCDYIVTAEAAAIGCTDIPAPER